MSEDQHAAYKSKRVWLEIIEMERTPVIRLIYLKETICRDVKADTTRWAQIILFLLSSSFLDTWPALKIRVNRKCHSPLWRKGEVGGGYSCFNPEVGECAVACADSSVWWIWYDVVAAILTATVDQPVLTQGMALGFLQPPSRVLDLNPLRPRGSPFPHSSQFSHAAAKPRLLCDVLELINWTESRCLPAVRQSTPAHRTGNEIVTLCISNDL